MTEMNRRDYLKRMGMATAVAMGSNLHAIAGTSSNFVPPDPVQANLGQWPTGTKPDPANFGVKLIFTGVLNFGYKGNEARVAFHRGHTDTHKMKIIVSEIVVTAEGKRACSDIYTIGDGSVPADIRKLEVGIKNKSSDARFFLGSAFDRAANTGDELDFRWLIDLEGPDGYRRDLPKHNRKFTTKMKVKHGTFYTYQRTNATFKGQGGAFQNKPFGHIAKVMAANIGRLNDGESVYLTINGKNVLPYPLTNRAQYEIYFFNERQSGSSQDFDMVFDAFDIDAGERFTLVLATPPKEESTTDLCHNLPEVERLSDEAPCMGGGFSSGNGFP